jgi:hypothetical protein
MLPVIQATEGEWTEEIPLNSGQRWEIETCIMGNGVLQACCIETE